MGVLFLNSMPAQPVDVLKSRPDPQGTATKVNVSLYIIDVESINNLKQSFTIDFVMTLWWIDPRVAENSPRLTLGEIWHPDAQIYNIRDAKKRLDDVVNILPNDTILYTQRYFGTFSAFLDFQAFPFDQQILPITLLSFTYGPEAVEFVFESAWLEERFSIAGWTVKSRETRVSAFNISAAQGAKYDTKLSRLNYTMHARRHLDYYWWKVVAPLVLIVFLSWAVFYIDPSQVGPQVGVSATSILTLIAFLLRLESIIPPVSYLTHMDYFVYSVLTLVFLAYLEALVSTTYALKGKIEFAKKVDHWSRYVFPTGFAIIMGYFWII